MKKTLLAAVIAFIFAASAFAGDLAGVSFPERVDHEGKSLVLNGIGLRKAYGIAKVYVAGLYLEKTTANADEILAAAAVRRIVLEFVRNVGRDDIVKAWTEGFEKNAGASFASLRDRLDALNKAMPDLREGDVLAFSTVPGKGTDVEVGGKRVATIPGDDFAKMLFAIWLGPSPPNAALKEGLLGRR